jgi:hypothetical protein
LNERTAAGALERRRSSTQRRISGSAFGCPAGGRAPVVPGCRRPAWSAAAGARAPDVGIARPSRSAGSGMAPARIGRRPQRRFNSDASRARGLGRVAIIALIITNRTPPSARHSRGRPPTLSFGRSASLPGVVRRRASAAAAGRQAGETCASAVSAGLAPRESTRSPRTSPREAFQDHLPADHRPASGAGRSSPANCRSITTSPWSGLQAGTGAGRSRGALEAENARPPAHHLRARLVALPAGLARLPGDRRQPIRAAATSAGEAPRCRRALCA